MKTAKNFLSIRCFRGERRRPTHRLTRTEAIAFRTAARHLVRYLTKSYGLDGEQAMSDPPDAQTELLEQRRVLIGACRYALNNVVCEYADSEVKEKLRAAIVRTKGRRS